MMDFDAKQASGSMDMQQVRTHGVNTPTLTGPNSGSYHENHQKAPQPLSGRAGEKRDWD
jgi:hypothetical protein